MKIGAVNNFKNPICDEIELIASEGFDFVDLTLEPLFSNGLEPEKVKKIIEKTDIEVIGHTSPFLPVIFPLESIRRASMEEFKKYVDFFKSIGVSLMNVHPSDFASLMSRDEIIESNIKFIKNLNEICRERKITLMVETGMKPFNSPEMFNVLLKGLDDIKVHLDVGHCNVQTDRKLTEEFFAEFGDRIVHVHFSDNYGDRDEHLPIGVGDIDWEYIASVLKKYGYDRTVTLEIFSPNRAFLLESKKYVEKLLNCK